MKELWIRLGVIIKITEAEEQAIFGDDEEKMRDALRLIIAEGRFCPDEETYVPSEAVQEFNRTYGTASFLSGFRRRSIRCPEQK